MTSSGELVAKWNYALFSGWTSPLSDSINNSFRPNVSLFPLTINIILVVLIFFSGYIVFFNSLEKITPQSNKLLYGYGIIALPILLIYYILIFPWELEGLYYPVIMIKNYETGLNYLYTIELGNILAIISFPLIFSYSFFYFMTSLRFEQKDTPPESFIHALIRNSQEEFDLDRLIAEEQVKYINNKKKENSNHT